MKDFPANLSPREACALALGAILHGAAPREVDDGLKSAGITIALEASPTSAKVTLRLSARRKAEAMAGCTTDAYVHALREALGSKDDA